MSQGYRGVMGVTTGGFFVYLYDEGKSGKRQKSHKDADNGVCDCIFPDRRNKDQ